MWLTLLLGGACQGLPEDRNMPIEIDADRSEDFLDEGVTVLYGNASEPAVITQGSLKISGLKITIQEGEEEIAAITVEGSPARFQQQPAIDKALVRARGEVIVYDRAAESITLDGAAELTQQGNTVSAQHIEYDIRAGRSVARSESGEERVRIVIPPGEAPE